MPDTPAHNNNIEGDTQTSGAGKQTLDNRHLFRQIIIQTLYQKNYQKEDDADVGLTLHEPDVDIDLDLEYVSGKLGRKLKKSIQDLDEIVAGIEKNLTELDAKIKEFATAWPIEQINPVDLQILRLAIYEGFIAKLVPAKVAIDEAIELARDFGTDNNVKFVSGVLGNIYATENPND